MATRRRGESTKVDILLPEVRPGPLWTHSPDRNVGLGEVFTRREWPSNPVGTSLNVAGGTPGVSTGPLGPRVRKAPPTSPSHMSGPSHSHPSPSAGREGPVTKDLLPERCSKTWSVCPSPRGRSGLHRGYEFRGGGVRSSSLVRVPPALRVPEVRTTGVGDRGTVTGSFLGPCGTRTGCHHVQGDRSR